MILLAMTPATWMLESYWVRSELPLYVCSKAFIELIIC